MVEGKAAPFERKRKSAVRPPQASAAAGIPQDETPLSDSQSNAIRRTRNAWYALCGLAVAAATWGLVAGWYFGLPLGGEIRDDPFDRRWHLVDLLRTIPHPVLADAPVAPLFDDYLLREKFAQNGVTWESQSVFAGVLPVPKPGPGHERLPIYDTNLRTSSRIVTLANRGGAKGLDCLSISLGVVRTDDLPCLAIPFDFPERRSVVLDRSAFRPVTINAGHFFDPTGKGKRPPSLTSQQAVPPATNETTVGILNVEPDPQVFRISAVTFGAESDAASVAPVIWVGRYDEIYKVALRSTNVISLTKYSLPTGFGSVALIVFLSADRGWVIGTYSDQERNVGRPPVVTTADGGATWQRLWYRWMPAPWVFGAFLIGMFAFERGTRAQTALRPVAAKAFITDHGVSDNPIGLDDADALGLAPIATALSRFLRNVETKPTVAFAITGPWGSGKSSLMNLVCEDLTDRGVCTVWFNAWHHQKEDNLLAALLSSIRAQAVPPLWTPAGINYRLRVGMRRMAQDWARTLVYAAIAAFAVALLWKFSDHLSNWVLSFEKPSPGAAQTTTDTFAKLVALVGISGTAIGGVLVAIKKIWDMFKPLQSLPGDLLASLGGTAKAANLDQQLSFRYRFQKEFSTFCEVLRSPPDPGLVIFIDDLDRCGPRQTVDVLEAINFVTNAGKCFVILGFDESKVKAAVADVYKDTILRIGDVGGDKNDPARKDELVRFASHYLEKLVHLVIPVPKSGKSTVEKLLGLKPVSPPSAQDRRTRRRRRAIFETVSALILVTVVAAGVSLAMDVFVRLASTATAKIEVPSATPPRAAPAVEAQAAAPVPAATASPAKALVSADKLREEGLLSSSAWGVIPPSAVVLAFILLIGIFGAQFIPRLSLVEPVVSDSDEFKSALEIWTGAIALRRTTPRDVKRFVNRLRFLAMRLRSVGEETARVGGQPPLDEARLVSFAAIEDLDPDRLGIENITKPEGFSFGQPVVDHGPTIMQGLKIYKEKFRKRLYQDPIALETYKRIAGLIEERGAHASEAESDEVTRVKA